MTKRGRTEAILHNRQHGNAIIAAYSKLILEMMDQKLERHFSKSPADDQITWSDDDLV